MSDKTTWIIGNDPSCDVFIDRPSVSWRHCQLNRRPDGSFTIDDLKSSNGTYVNGRRVVGTTPVRRSDVVNLGTSVTLPWPAEAESPSSPVQSLPPASRIIRVGRDLDNDYVIDRPEISSHHARIMIAPGGLEGLVEDLESTNGTALGNPDNAVRLTPLKPVDVIFFGSVRVPASTFFPKSSSSVAEEMPELIVQENCVTVGRDDSCDLVVDFPMISGRHARVDRVHGVILLQDLGSSNGTFLNGKPIDRPTPVHNGDLVGLGGYTLVIVDGNAAVGRTTPPSEPLVLGPDIHQPTPDSAAFVPSDCEHEPVNGRGAFNPLLCTVGVLVGLDLVITLAARMVFDPSPAHTLFIVTLLSATMGLTIPFVARAFQLISNDHLTRSLTPLVASFALSLPLAALPLIGFSGRLPLGDRGSSVLGLLWLTSMVGASISQALLRLFNEHHLAMLAAVVLGVAMFVIGGTLRPLPSLPIPARAVAALLPTRWAFEGVLTILARDPRIAVALDRAFPLQTERAGLLACTTALLALLGGLVYLNLVIAPMGNPPRPLPSRRRF